MYDIVCLGESVIDLTPIKKDKDLKSSKGFYTNPGGSSLNTAVQAARLGAKTALISKMGIDPFSEYLKDFLKNENVATENIVINNDFTPALAFVSYKNNKPDFYIIKDRSQKHYLTDIEFPFDILTKTKIFQFGSFFSYQPKTYDLIIKILKKAKENNVFCCFDPNIRKHTIESKKEIQKNIEDYSKYVSCIKLSIDDINNLYTNIDPIEICNRFVSNGCEYVILTKDINGGILFFKNKKIDFRAFPQYSGDSIGAGDTFNAAFLYCLSKNINNKLDKEKLLNILEFSSASSALCCKDFGALTEKLTYDKINNIQNT